MKSNKNISYIDKKGQVNTSTFEKTTEKSDSFDYTKYLNIGFYLAIPLLVGVFAGIKLDEIFNKKPLFTIVFIVLGAISTFYNLIRLTKENAKH